jgi:NitT/TauT family transport system substrate-binding protein
MEDVEPKPSDLLGSKSGLVWRLQIASAEGEANMSLGEHGKSRRTFLRRVGALAAAGVLPISATRPVRAAGPLKPVKMIIDWLHQGPNDGFIIAREKGFYEQVGLDVTVEPGKGSGSTAQLLANKVAQFGFSDGYVVGNSVSKGMNLKMVAGVFRRNPTAVITLSTSDIKKPQDLEGKTIGIPTGAAQFQQWPAFAKGCGVDTSKVKIVNVDPAGAVPAVITGQVDAIAGFAQGLVPSIEIRGNKQARLLWYADCGVTAMSNGIIVHTDLLKQDPELIRVFVGASLKGFLYGRQHPDEAVDIIKKYLPASDIAISRREMELSWNTWVTPNTAGKPLGWMSDKDWAATVEVLKKYGGVATPLDPNQLFTNEFVPTGAEFIPPQT